MQVVPDNVTAYDAISSLGRRHELHCDLPQQQLETEQSRQIQTKNIIDIITLF